jgi:anaerobic magnesium-protoporphyrin IX monomethyl ester cyclase
MDKGIRLSEVSVVLRDAQACGIRNHVYVIVGFPTETLGELQQTVDFLDQHQDVISMVHRGTFTLEADTPICDDPAKFSILRTWKQSDGIVPRALGYECSQGLSREQAAAAFQHVLPFFRAFNPFAPNLGNYRDHALLVYAKLGATLPMSSRRFPPKPTLG